MLFYFLLVRSFLPLLIALIYWFFLCFFLFFSRVWRWGCRIFQKFFLIIFINFNLSIFILILIFWWVTMCLLVVIISILFSGTRLRIIIVIRLTRICRIEFFSLINFGAILFPSFILFQNLFFIKKFIFYWWAFFIKFFQLILFLVNLFSMVFIVLAYRFSFLGNILIISTLFTISPLIFPLYFSIFIFFNGFFINFIPIIYVSFCWPPFDSILLVYFSTMLLRVLLQLFIRFIFFFYTFLVCFALQSFFFLLFFFVMKY